MIPKILGAIFAILVCTGAASSATWVVPTDATTIQAAIDLASTGDTVLLADGTYTGDGNRNIDFGGRAITVRSMSDDATVCIIDCQDTPGARGFVFQSGEQNDAVLRTVTITNGWAFGSGVQDLGGAVLCRNGSAPSIESVIFSGNLASDQGGAVACVSAGARIVGCEFSGNVANNGGAVFGHVSTLTIEECRFLGNSGTSTGGAIQGQNSSFALSRCAFTANTAVAWGGAISFLGIGGQYSVTECVFSSSSSGTGKGGALYVSEAVGEILDSTFHGSEAAEGSAMYVLDTVLYPERVILSGGLGGAAVSCTGSSDVSAVCCDIYGNAGGNWVGCLSGQLGMDGNISQDPLYCDEEGGDFHLQWESPCLATNSGGCGLIGCFDAGGCESVAVESESWTRIKADHR